jgi:hypothetical protein
MTKYNEVKKFFNNEIFSQLPSHHFTSIVGRTTKFAKVIANLNPTLVIPEQYIDKLKTFISYIVWLESLSTKYDQIGTRFTESYLEEIMQGIVYEIIFCEQMKANTSTFKDEINAMNKLLNIEYISILDSLPDLEPVENITIEKIYSFAQELYNTQNPIRRFLYWNNFLPEIQSVIDNIYLTYDYGKIKYKLK